MRGKGGKPVVVDPKDRAKIIALYGAPAYMEIKDIQLRFHGYTPKTIRDVLIAAGIEIKSAGARSGAFMSPTRRKIA